ncbi:MAG TPA: GerMN domain-containing protein [Ilumatobacteraceae bacterium]|jgi:hypothetical protein
MTRRLGLIIAVLVVLVVACGIPNHGEVARIPDNQVGVLDDTVPTTSTTTTTTPATTIEPTTTTIAEVTSTTIATQEVNLYFISGGILRAVPTPLTKGAAPAEVLNALQGGPPSGDIGGGLRTAVPKAGQASLKIAPNDGSGVARVDLPANFFSVVKQEDQRWAIGQIVLTLTDIGGIGQVLFTQVGAPVGVPRGAGDFTAPEQAVPRKDYLELLEAPIPTTTTTSAPPPVTGV